MHFSLWGGGGKKKKKKTPKPKIVSSVECENRW